MITIEDIKRIKKNDKSEKDLELNWHAEGIGKQPIKIFGRNKKLMLMTLAILQSPINTFRCKVTGLKRTKDFNKKPLKLTFKQ